MRTTTYECDQCGKDYPMPPTWIISKDTIGSGINVVSGQSEKYPPAGFDICSRDCALAKLGQLLEPTSTSKVMDLTDIQKAASECVRIAMGESPAPKSIQDLRVRVFRMHIRTHAQSRNEILKLVSDRDFLVSIGVQLQ